MAAFCGDAAIRLYAAKDILSRAGVRPAESAEYYSDIDQVSEEELRDKILNLMDDLTAVDDDMVDAILDDLEAED
jgi:hypothetical protein